MISVIIPARNEGERIAATAAAARALPGVAEVIVVDDASGDDTAARARIAGARVISRTRSQGKGAAMDAGAEQAAGDILLFLDADLEESAAEASRLIPPVLSGEADMTIAVFPAPPGGKGGWGNVVRVARIAIRHATGHGIAAPLSGQRCLRRAVWEAIRPPARGFGVETAMTLDALRAGFRIREIPVDMHHRVTGRDLPGCLHRARQLRDVILALIPRLLRRRT